MRLTSVPTELVQRRGSVKKSPLRRAAGGSQTRGRGKEKGNRLRVAFLRDITAIKLQLQLAHEVGRERVHVLQLPLARDIMACT